MRTCKNCFIEAVADLRLCFCICKNLVFSLHGSYSACNYLINLPVGSSKGRGS